MTCCTVVVCFLLFCFIVWFYCFIVSLFVWLVGGPPLTIVQVFRSISYAEVELSSSGMDGMELSWGFNHGNLRGPPNATSPKK